VAGVPVLVEPDVFAAAAAWEAAHPEMEQEAERWEEAPGAAEIVAEVKAKWPGYGPHPHAR